MCVAEALTRIFNTFASSALVLISSTKCIHHQDEKCSSPAQNALVASSKPVDWQCDKISIWRWREETISSLAINTFIYSVKWRSEVSSRDCLIASDKQFCLLFEILFRPPQKEQKLGEKASEKTSFHVELNLSKTQKQGRNEKTQHHHLLRNDGRPHYGLQAGMRKCKKTTLHLLPISCGSRVVFLHSLILAWRLERRPPSFRSSRWCWVFSSQPCFCPFTRVKKFLQNLI